MVGKRNFRNSVEVERYLYRVSQDLKDGWMNAAEVNAAGRIAATWLKAHEQRQENEILKKLGFLEEALRQKQKPEVIR